ncbi:hypothetical protein [Streptomyces sp. NPDC056682]|uniref:hypothetical protein n=1 Tax=Streptomyces sp. NPDC056682 TaxID=3345909 RepID=UPI0036A2BFC2
MHGPGYGPPPPRPSGAAAIVLRVLFALVPLVSFGLLSWTALLRLAIVTRRGAHWALFWAQLTVYVVFFTFVGMAPDDNDWRMNVGMIGLLTLAVASSAFYLYADIRHGARPPAPTGPYGMPAGYGPPHIPHTTAPQFGPYANPYAETPAPHWPPVPAPSQPHGPAGPRIDRVRAELDELSQYLRKESGESGEGGHR